MTKGWRDVGLQRCSGWGGWRPRRAWQWGAIALIAIALALRWVHLDRPLYWQDEIATSVRLAGLSYSELHGNLVGRVFPLGSLADWYDLSPDRGWGAAWAQFRSRPEHPPLYFSLVRGWALLWGNTAVGTRSLSVLVSYLTIPAAIGLVRELGRAADQLHPTADPERQALRQRRRSLLGWLLAIELALSPLHFYYAREARQYTLWVVLILASGAALARATRQDTGRSWLVYGLLLTAAMYTHLFSALVALAHGVYVAWISRWRWRSQWGHLGLAWLGVAIAFAPWAWLLISNSSVGDATGWLLTPEPRFQTLLRWLRAVGAWGWDQGDIWRNLSRGDGATLGVLSIALGSLLWVGRGGDRTLQAWVIPSVLIPIGVLGLPAIIKGHMLAWTIRYQFPAILGGQVAIAAALAAAWTGRHWGRRLALVSLVLLAVLHLKTLQAHLQATTWWYSGGTAITSVLSPGSSSSERLLAGDVAISEFNNLLVLGTIALPEMPFVWFPTEDPMGVWPGDRDQLLLFRPSAKLRQVLEQEPTVTLTPTGPDYLQLWTADRLSN